MYKIIKSATNHDAEFGKVRYFYRTEPNPNLGSVRFGSVKFGFGRSIAPALQIFMYGQNGTDMRYCVLPTYSFWALTLTQIYLKSLMCV